MKFVQLLDEKYYKTLKVDVWGDLNNVEIFENPTRNELRDVSGQFESVRGGIVDNANPKVYVWNAQYIHYNMPDSLKYDLGFSYDYHDSMKFNSFNIKLKSDGDFIDKLKNRKKVLNKLKSLFPKETYMLDADDNVYDLKTGELLN